MSGVIGKEGLGGGHGETVAGVIKPIRPEDIAGEKAKIIPDLVIESFNTLIAQRSVNGVARVLQDDVLALLVEKVWIEMKPSKKAGWTLRTYTVKQVGMLLTTNLDTTNHTLQVSLLGLRVEGNSLL